MPREFGVELGSQRIGSNSHSTILFGVLILPAFPQSA
jgi:hypothetical protein